METSEVLNKAADLIEKRGWIGYRAQLGAGPLFDPWGRHGNGPICLEGGIMAAAGLAWTFEASQCPAGLAVRAYLGGRLRSPFLYEFNDRPERTASEVIEVLRATALIEAAREQAAERESVSA